MTVILLRIPVQVIFFCEFFFPKIFRALFVCGLLSIVRIFFTVFALLSDTRSAHIFRGDTVNNFRTRHFCVEIFSEICFAYFFVVDACVHHFSWEFFPGFAAMSDRGSGGEHRQTS